MKYQALIQYKNDEEYKGPVFEDFWEALNNLSKLVNDEVTSEGGFSPEDVQFAQVQGLED